MKGGGGGEEEEGSLPQQPPRPLLTFPQVMLALGWAGSSLRVSRAQWEHKDGMQMLSQHLFCGFLAGCALPWQEEELQSSPSELLGQSIPSPSQMPRGDQNAG